MTSSEIFDLIKTIAAALSPAFALGGVALGYRLNSRLPRRIFKEQMLEKVHIEFSRLFHGIALIIGHLEIDPQKPDSKQLVDAASDVLKAGSPERLTYLIEIHFPDLSPILSEFAQYQSHIATIHNNKLQGRLSQELAIEITPKLFEQTEKMKLKINIAIRKAGVELAKS